MIDLSTNYLGLKLKNPLVVSASLLSEELDNLKRMEDSGASAVVLYSLFEEQLLSDEFEISRNLIQGAESTPEALTYFPSVNFHIGPDEYLEHIRKAKESVKIPVIASLNGASRGGWTNFAKWMEEAGADALELNIYTIPADPDLPGEAVEKSYLDILKMVREKVKIPIALKLSPYFSSFSNMAKQFDQAGADGLVLFNRFYQPDIDLELLEVRSNLLLSTPQALRLPLNWIAILYGRIRSDLAATGGIHNERDVLKVLMAGAKVAMLCSVLFKNGIGHIKSIEEKLLQWMEKYEYESINQMLGSMSQIHSSNPGAFERAQYMLALTTFNPAKH